MLVISIVRKNYTESVFSNETVHESLRSVSLKFLAIPFKIDCVLLLVLFCAFSTPNHRDYLQSIQGNIDRRDNLNIVVNL